MITQPLTKEEFLQKFRAGQLGDELINITNKNVTDGPFTVFLSRSEEYWNKPYAKPRSQPYQIKTVILQATMIAVQKNQFQATLFGNNGFEKDGQTFWFPKDELLCEQNFTDSSRLGVWQMEQDEKMPEGRGAEYYSNSDNVRHDLNQVAMKTQDE